MHEVGIVQELIDEIKSQVKTQNAGKITKIKVNVGKLEELTLDSFRFWFEQLSQGTVAEGAEIELTPTNDAGVYLQHLEMEIDE